MNVTRGGYYAFIKRPKSNSQIEREVLETFVKRIFTEHEGRYGSNRILRELARIDIHTSKKRVARIMAKLGLQAKGTPKRYRKTNAPSCQEKENILDRVFSTNDRNSVWVGDITYIPTKQGFLHLAGMIDLYSRKVVGWSMSSGMSERLATGALNQAIGREGPCPGLIIHTDRGSQYTSRAFQKALGEKGFTHSMSRKGNPYDNAVSESFFRTLKRELVKGAAFEDRLVAQQAIFKYIELYYNTRRMHSSLGYKSPLEYERQSA